MPNSTMFFDNTVVSGSDSGSSGSTSSMSQATPRSIKTLQYVSTKKQRNGDDPDNYRGWRYEIHKKISEFKGTFEEFLERLVPSSAPYLSCVQLATVFEALRKEAAIKDEDFMYEPLVTGLNKLSAEFSAEKRLWFVDTHKKTFAAPYAKRTPSHGNTRPDIVALFPGQEASAEVPANVWGNISLGMEVKSSKRPDPMKSRSNESESTLIQLAKSACRLLLAHGGLCCFLVGFYGSTARVFRFDHAAAVVSPAFDYREHPELLHKFLWRFVHPQAVNAPFAGSNDYCSVPTSDDIKKAKQALAATWNDSDEENNRWIKIPSQDLNGALIEYLTLRPRSINSRIFSRATNVQEIVRRGDSRRLVLKTSWRQVVRSDECRFYRRIKAYADRVKQALFGLAGLVHGIDMGEYEAGHVPTGQTFHRTVTSSYRGSPSAHLGERSYMLLVLDTVGQPLSEFLTTRELVEALRDAIKGHRMAYMAGVLHRDVSFGNVMIARDRPFKGFLDDFDYSSLIDSFADGGTALTEKEKEELSKEVELKERTGTFAFLAIELLDMSTSIIHGVHHDLESFYWLLIWVVLRHTNHTHRKGNRAFGTLFDAHSEAAARAAKRDWFHDVRHSGFGVKDNVPFTHLLSRLADIVTGTLEWPLMPDPSPLTYQPILDAFDEALDMEGWPTNDPALPFTAPKTDSEFPEPDKPKPRASAKRSRQDDTDDEEERQSKQTRLSSFGLGSGFDVVFT